MNAYFVDNGEYGMVVIAESPGKARATYLYEIGELLDFTMSLSIKKLVTGIDLPRSAIFDDDTFEARLLYDLAGAYDPPTEEQLRWERGY